MPRNLDLRLLRTFTTAARCLSMTATADILHLTQGAISQHIKRLEEQLGERLFVRTRTGVSLTEAGHKLLANAETLLHKNDEIYREFGMTPPAQRVRIGLPIDLVSRYFPLILKPYSKSHPHVEVSLVSGASSDIAAALEAGHIDLAVLEEPEDAASGERLAIDRLVWIGSANSEASLKRPLPISLISSSCAFSPIVASALNERGIHWKATFTDGSLDATIAAIQTDLAVGVWLSSIVPAGVQTLGPESALPELPGFVFSLHMMPHLSTGYILDMAHHIRAAFSDIPPSKNVAVNLHPVR